MKSTDHAKPLSNPTVKKAKPIIKDDSLAASKCPFEDSVEYDVPYVLFDDASEPDFSIRKGFRVTPEELFQLVKYWEKLALENSYTMWLTMMVGGTESRQLAYAYGRIKYLEKFVEPEKFNQACEVATAEFASQLKPRY